MMNSSIRFPQFCTNTLTAILSIGMISGVMVTGSMLNLLDRSVLNLDAAAYAQSPNPQIGQYARAAYEIEQMRQRDYAEAKRIMGGNVPGDVCRQQSIPAPVHDICSRFLSNSTDIIKKNGLTIAQFNEMTRRKEADPALQQQLQSELLRLQKGGQ